RLRRREDAGVTRRGWLARVVNRYLPVKTDGRARYQRLAVFDTGTVDELAGGKVVAAVEHDVHAGQQLIEQGIVCARRDWRELNVGVDCRDGLLDGVCLELPDAGQ